MQNLEVSAYAETLEMPFWKMYDDSRIALELNFSPEVFFK